MTIEEAIFLVDELKPNQIERARKIEWLSRLDLKFYRDIVCRHEKDADTPEEFIPYDSETDEDTELLIKAPYDEVYRFYLEMHIDLVNQEYDKYNNSATLYAVKWGELTRAYHREHRPIPMTDAMRF